MKKINKKAELTGLFVFIVCFVILAVLIGGLIGVSLTTSDPTDSGKETSTLAAVIKILTFQTNDSVSNGVALFLYAMTIFSGFIIYRLIRSG